MPKITFLGTNGWYDSATGNTISILIETPQYYLVLDAGNGIAKLEKYIRDDRPVYLFISHFHLDHIAGLHTLDMNPFSRGLQFIIQEGGAAILRGLLRQPFTATLAEQKFQTRFIEVPQNIDELPFSATVLPMRHSCLTLGIRLELAGKTIAYCSDTGYCENAVALARNADLVMAECAYQPQQTSETWPHLNPETAARIAREAEAQNLILVHFDAHNYPTLESREQALHAAREVFNSSSISRDDLTIQL